MAKLEAARPEIKEGSEMVSMPPIKVLDRPWLENYRFVSMKPDSGEELMTLIRIPSVLARAFGATPKIEKYRGSSTVWHSFPDFERQDTLMEVMLFNFWKRAVYERKS